jgi:hypothetical protein
VAARVSTRSGSGVDILVDAKLLAIDKSDDDDEQATVISMVVVVR